MIRLGIVGYRNFTDYVSLKAAVLKVLQEWNIELTNVKYIVSGGAIGTDILAEKFAKEFNIPTLIYKPEYNLYHGKAPLLRNTTIVENLTHLIAFPSVNGKGTQDTIKKAINKAIPIKVLYIDKK